MYILLQLLVFILFLFGCDKKSEIHTGFEPKVIIIDQQALTCKNGIYGNIINGQSFQQDAIFSIEGWQYTAYYNNDRKLCVARRQINNPTWEKLQLSGYTFSKVPGYENDTHNTISLGYCLSDGTIHLAFDTHATPLNYSFSVKGLLLNPKMFKWDSTLFSSVSHSLQNGILINEFSYPSFLATNTGDLLLGYRDGYSGVLNYKIAHYNGFKSSWDTPRIVINGSGNYNDYYSGVSAARGAYVNGLDINTKSGQLFISWTWREDFKEATTANRDIYSSFSNNSGLTWFGHRQFANGSLIAGNSQIFSGTEDANVKKLDRGWGIMNQQAQAYDQYGHPHILMYHRKERVNLPGFASIKDGFYFHYYLKDTTWIENRIPFIGSRPKIVFDTKNNMYLIFVDKDHFDYTNGAGRLTILKSSESSGWSNWKVVFQSQKKYFSEPLIDRNRWIKSNILSVFIQELPLSEGLFASLMLLEFPLL